jgi:hypothetical protein
MSEEDLKVATVFKQNYVRQMKGKQNRIGHNWEAAVEWFIDRFTVGAIFQTQHHRTNVMEPRRITLHLMKSVGGRKHNAEVDRVWSVTPGLFAQPITYVLECKWGLVQKYVVDDFLEVLRWSTEFGVNTSEGRQMKQGVIGVFAGSAFDPKESVKLEDQTKISLAAYAARINIQLLRAADFNEKMREKGIQKEVTVQGVCRVAKDEKEVREILTSVWNAPEKANEIFYLHGTQLVQPRCKIIYTATRLWEAVKRVSEPAGPVGRFKRFVKTRMLFVKSKVSSHSCGHSFSFQYSSADSTQNRLWK